MDIGEAEPTNTRRGESENWREEPGCSKSQERIGEEEVRRERGTGKLHAVDDEYTPTEFSQTSGCEASGDACSDHDRIELSEILRHR